jgi:hypothetical protein
VLPVTAIPSAPVTAIPSAPEATSSAPVPMAAVPSGPVQAPYPPPGTVPSYGGYPNYPAYAAYPARPQESSNAIVALILAISAWVVCPVIPAIVALVFAARADREIRASAGAITGLGMSTAAKVVAWINIGVLAAVILIMVAFLVIAIALGAMDANLQATRLGNI